MIRRLSIRAKLVLLVTVPLLAMIVVAVPGIATRLDRVRSETRARDLAAGPVADLAATVRTLQDESALSAWYVATGDAGVQARLQEARRATTTRLADLPEVEQAASEAGAGDTASRIAALRRGISLLPPQRVAVDARVASDDSLIDTYQGLADATVRALDASASAPDDTTAAANLRDTATLTRLANATALERAIVLDAFARGGLSGTLQNELAAAVATQDASRQAFLGQAGDDLREIVDARAASSPTSAAVVAMRSAALERRYAGNGFTAAQWYDTSTAHVDEQFSTVDAARRRTESLASDRRDRALEEALLYVGGALVAMLLVAALTIAIARAIVRPLRRLTKAARDVSQRQLPRLVDALRHEDLESVPRIEPIDVDSRDEIGELATAFNDIEATTETVAREQREVLRKGIGDLYLNLARRNQSLLERQFGVIDELEADEEDPEKLEALFRLDHLATRMRRNAESLLVLAGLDQVRPNTTPVAMREVVRGALSEIVGYARVDVVGVSELLSVRGDVAIDLSHAIAELLENAVTFSPPASRILVAGERRGADYELTISDEGIGMAPDRVAALNDLLANPPLPGLHLSRALGLVVVSRLAARTGTRVRLRSASEVGTSALITIPVALIVDRAEPARPIAPPAELEAPALAPPTRPGLALGVAPPAPPAPPAPSAPPAAPVALPSGPPPAADEDEPDLLPATSRVARRQARKRRGRGRGRSGAPPARATAAVAGPKAAAESAAVTEAGLPKRSPTTPEVDLVRAEPPLAPSPRPPDEVFELVARFEAGRRRVGRDDQSPGQPDSSPPDPEHEEPA